jgi:NADH dehydrogenase
VSAVVSTASSVFSSADGDTIESVDRGGQLSLVGAAGAAGVRRFVYVSFAPMAVDSPLQQAKRVVERNIQASGMSHAILRPANFMEIWLSPALGFDAIHATARVVGDGTAPVSWISFRDVARVAVAAIGAGEDSTLEFGVPEALSPLEVVRVFEDHLGASFSVEHVAEAAVEGQLRAAPDPLAASFAAMMLSTARSAPTAPAALSGLRSVRDFARELAEAAHR